MNINSYIEKMRSRPPEERQKIALIATGVSFAIIFLIWIVSFSEMNKTAEPPAEEQTAPEENFSAGKSSIEEMFQGLPAEDDTSGATGTDNSVTDNSSVTDPNSVDANGNAIDNIGNNSAENQSQDANSIQDNQPEIPPLP
jgi:hypothetical protein